MSEVLGEVAVQLATSKHLIVVPLQSARNPAPDVLTVQPVTSELLIAVPLQSVKSQAPDVSSV